MELESSLGRCRTDGVEEPGPAPAGTDLGIRAGIFKDSCCCVEAGGGEEEHFPFGVASEPAEKGPGTGASSSNFTL